MRVCEHKVEEGQKSKWREQTARTKDMTPSTVELAAPPPHAMDEYVSGQCTKRAGQHTHRRGIPRTHVRPMVRSITAQTGTRQEGSSTSRNRSSITADRLASVSIPLHHHEER